MIAVALLVLVFSLWSKRSRSTPITPPLFFMVGGLLLGTPGLGLMDMHTNERIIHLFAELTLIVLLFTDAAMIRLEVLRAGFGLPVRMLAIGLPLTIAAGALMGRVLLPEFGWYGAALLAAILAPTDAALGQAVVSNPVVPERIRTGLSTESGLNDGIALPVVLVMAACTEAHGSGDLAPWIGYAAAQVTLGPLVGLAAGWLGVRALNAAEERGWVEVSFEQLIGLSLSIVAWGCAEAIGGNGFIAAFVAGLTFGNTGERHHRALREFSEAEGQLLSLITFCLFGAIYVVPAVEAATAATWLYALLSLTLVRMLPVALSLIGSGEDVVTRLFCGWFGPRGLASILFGLLIVERQEIGERHQLFEVVALVVATSVVLHGMTASPLARVYGRRVAAALGRRSGSLNHETG